MENSCRKKYRMSSKNWISASRHTGFRRNSALIPANAGLFHYAGNNPVRYIDPDGRVEDELSRVDKFLSNADEIMGFIFSVTEAVAKGEKATISVISEKFNELGVVDGVVTGLMPGRGDPYKCKLFSSTASKTSNLFLGLTIALNFIDVLIVDYKTDGDSAAVTRRSIRNTVITGSIILATKGGTWLGSKFGSGVGSFFAGVGSIPGGIIGGFIGGAVSGTYINYKLNKIFDEMGW